MVTSDQGVYKEKLLGVPGVTTGAGARAGARLTVPRPGSEETQECCS